MNLCKFIGYMPAEEAFSKGFTHHGKYYGIPVWLSVDDPDFPVVAKWSPAEYLIDAACFIEGTLRPIFFPNDEPVFQFLVGEPITLKIKIEGIK